MNTWDKGDVVRLLIQFKGLDGLHVDPTTVIVRVKDPVGVVTSYTYLIDANLIKDGVGQYHRDIEPTIQGVWKYRWEGIGTNKGAEENAFMIRESEFD